MKKTQQPEKQAYSYYIQKNKRKNNNNFSSEAMQARRQWNKIFKALKKICLLRILILRKYLSEIKAK